MKATRDHRSRAVVGCLLIALLVPAMATGSAGSSAKFMLVRVPVDSAEQAAYLLGNFDETHNHGEGAIELLLWPGDAARLAAAGLDYEVLVPDMYAHDQAIAAAAVRQAVDMPGPDRSDYRRMSDYNEEMALLAKEHPSLVRLFELPHETLEGRTVYGIEIAHDVMRKDGRPTFHIDGAHHAREWPSAEFPMIFAHHLVETFGRDPQITSLLKKLRITIVPVVNVDGFGYSRDAPLSQSAAGDRASYEVCWLGCEGYWRKNRRSLTGITAPSIQRNPDAYGVDPNRNYSYLWGSPGGASDVPADQTYRGSSPFSEAEPRNVRDLVLSRHVTSLVTNHTYGELVLRPWSHTSFPTPDEGTMQQISERMAVALGGYENVVIGSWITATGDTINWSYAATRGLGFGIELCEAFHPPYSECVQQDHEKVIDAFLIAARAAADDDRHAVITGRVIDERGNPVRAELTITKQWQTPLGAGSEAGERPVERLRTTMATDRTGRFVWHVNPSTRPIPEAGERETYRLKISVAGGTSKTLEVVVHRGQRLHLGPIRVERS